MSDDEVKRREVFDKYDVEKECSIQTFEIENALQSLDMPANKEDVELIVKELGITSPSISFEQFNDVVDKAEALEDKRELLEAFRHFDKNNTGSISYATLKQILKPIMGKGFSEEELDVMVLEADADGSGTIELAEFVDFLSS